MKSAGLFPLSLVSSRIMEVVWTNSPWYAHTMTCLKKCESFPGPAYGEPNFCVKLRFHFYVKKSSRLYLLDYMVKAFF